MTLTFYYLSGSPFSWKVWFALEHMAIPYEYRRLSVDQGDLRKAEFALINPRHKVPVIVDDGFTLYESAVIIEYLEEKFGDGEASLWPANIEQRALARRVATEATEYVYPPLRKLVVDILFRHKGVQDADLVDASKKIIGKELALLENAFNGDFIAGSVISAADFALYPFIALLKRIDKMQPGHNTFNLVPERMRSWMNRIEALSYFSKTYPPHWKNSFS